ncbi:MAG: hypothetical protein J0I26_04810 [Alphaproteobacteria bacterium]|nr:hypothetical protein [Alphaproteobacteria bacterium]MBN9556832.1 hypothetical protein [Alphaproteobacteria bacterium]MBN9566190.1 hypothetical protein [Alphaproteobacteria bacterium]MBN9579644.1 hypothetical protein [Alphaproteobacteria bacterium]MBN9591519.1 hypothetical protein [Alphaproteobacteria bacterium]
MTSVEYWCRNRGAQVTCGVVMLPEVLSHVPVWQFLVGIAVFWLVAIAFVLTRTGPKCSHCGSRKVKTDDRGAPHCGACGAERARLVGFRHHEPAE